MTKLWNEECGGGEREVEWWIGGMAIGTKGAYFVYAENDYLHAWFWEIVRILYASVWWFDYGGVAHVVNMWMKNGTILRKWGCLKYGYSVVLVVILITSKTKIWISIVKSACLSLRKNMRLMQLKDDRKKTEEKKMIIHLKWWSWMEKACSWWSSGVSWWLCNFMHLHG